MPGRASGSAGVQALEREAAIRIGEALRAHREARGLAPEALARRLGISRAALYRVEKGDIAKVETLGRIADELGCGLDDLVGYGVEYYPEAPALFERMAALEAQAHTITGVFGPVSYLMTSDAYDTALHQALAEGGEGARGAAVMRALAQRKRQFREGRTQLRSIVALADLEHFAGVGLRGRLDLPPAILRARRDMARAEIMALAQLFRAPSPRIQPRLIEAPGAVTSLEIVTGPSGDDLVVSPFSLGDRPNIAIGIGSVSRAPRALESHREVVEHLWASGMAGETAANRLEQLLAGVPG